MEAPDAFCLTKMRVTAKSLPKSVRTYVMYLCTYVCKGGPSQNGSNSRKMKPPNPLSKVYEKRALGAAGVIFVIRALLGLKTMCQKALYTHKYITYLHTEFGVIFRVKSTLAHKYEG